MLPKCWHYAVDWVSSVDQCLFSSWSLWHFLFWVRCINVLMKHTELVCIGWAIGCSPTYSTVQYLWLPLSVHPSIWRLVALRYYKMGILSFYIAGSRLQDLWLNFRPSVVFTTTKLKYMAQSMNMVDLNDAYHESAVVWKSQSEMPLHAFFPNKYICWNAIRFIKSNSKAHDLAITTTWNTNTANWQEVKIYQMMLSVSLGYISNHRRTIVCVANLWNQEFSTLIYHFSNQAKILVRGIMANVTLTYVFATNQCHIKSLVLEHRACDQWHFYCLREMILTSSSCKFRIFFKEYLTVVG